MNYRIIALGLMLLAGSAWPHHNMSALFDFNDRVTLTGTLTKFDWRNPHIQFSVDVKNPQGQMETWSFEGPRPASSALATLARAILKTPSVKV